MAVVLVVVVVGGGGVGGVFVVLVLVINLYISSLVGNFARVSLLNKLP